MAQVDFLGSLKSYAEGPRPRTLLRRQSLLRFLDEKYRLPRDRVEEALESVRQSGFPYATKAQIKTDALVYENAARYLDGNKKEKEKLARRISQAKHRGSVPTSLSGVRALIEEKKYSWQDLGLKSPPKERGTNLAEAIEIELWDDGLFVPLSPEERDKIEKTSVGHCMGFLLLSDREFQELSKLLEEAEVWRGLFEGSIAEVRRLYDQVDGLRQTIRKTREQLDTAETKTGEVRREDILDLLPTRTDQGDCWHEAIPLVYNQAFQKRLLGLEEKIQFQVVEAIESLAKLGSRHPGLRTEKSRHEIMGLSRGGMLSRVNGEWRFGWIQEEGQIRIVFVALHQEIHKRER